MAQANFDNITSIKGGPLEPTTMLNQLRIAGSERPADKVVADALVILQDAQRPSIDPSADFDATVLAFEAASESYRNVETGENLRVLAWTLVAVVTPVTIGPNDSVDQVKRALACVEQAPDGVWSVIADGQDRGPEEMRSAMLDQLAGMRDRRRCEDNAGISSYPVAT